MLNISESLIKTQTDYFNRFENIVTPTKCELLTIGERINSFALLILAALGTVLMLDRQLLSCSIELIAQIWTGKIYREDRLLSTIEQMKNDMLELTREVAALKEQLKILK